MSTEQASALALHNLSLAFANKPVVSNLSFDLASGETLCLLGPSGCGKTTVLKCIAGLLTPDAGDIVISGSSVVGDNFVPVQKRNIGFIFQDYALFPHMTVAQNIAYGLDSKQSKRQRVIECLLLVDLIGLGNRYPHQLSGGQQQRVALARALAPKPSLILMDEPFSNVDAQLKRQMMAELKTIFNQAQVSCIFVTHAKEEAFAFADKVAVMLDGKIAQYGLPHELMNHPVSQAVANFMQAGNLLSSADAQLIFGNEQSISEGYWLFKPENIRVQKCDNDGKRECVEVEHIEQVFNGREYQVTLRLGQCLLTLLSPSKLAVFNNDKVKLSYNRPPFFIAGS
ncbi:MAG: ABC transporter ATP-binding protein [Parashewanella sp.]